MVQQALEELRAHLGEGAQLSLTYRGLCEVKAGRTYLPGRQLVIPGAEPDYTVLPEGRGWLTCVAVATVYNNT